MWKNIRYVYELIFQWQRLFLDGWYTDCKSLFCSHIQIAYDDLQKGVKDRIVLHTKTSCFGGLKQQVKAQN